MDGIQSNGDNFIEICDDLNLEIKKKNEQALEDYVKLMSSNITKEFVRKIRTWDQKRLDSLQEKINTETTNQSTSDNEILSERVIRENFKQPFKNLLSTILTQCRTYIELVDVSKTIPSELKARLKKIYLTIQKETEMVKQNKQFQIKDNPAFLDFIKGRAYTG